MAELILCELSDARAYGVPSLSPFCLKIHAALRVAELPFARRHGDRPDAFRAYNPAGQVPVLLEDGAPIADSTPILRRIVALAPDRIAADAESWLWEELADTALNGFLVASRWADERNWPRVREAYFGDLPAPVKLVVPGYLRRQMRATLVARDVWRLGPDACWARFSALLDHLDARAPVDGWWCGGRTPSVADLGLYGQLRSFGTPLTPDQAGWVAARPRLSRWLARVEGAAEAARAAA